MLMSHFLFPGTWARRSVQASTHAPRTVAVSRTSTLSATRSSTSLLPSRASIRSNTCPTFTSWSLKSPLVHLTPRARWPWRYASADWCLRRLDEHLGCCSRGLWRGHAAVQVFDCGFWYAGKPGYAEYERGLWTRH